MSDTWNYRPGEIVNRKEVETRFGGSRDRGISVPARKSIAKDVMLWWNPSSKRSSGYSNGWTSEGIFCFSGMGQKGDQQFTGYNSENGSVRDHKQLNLRLRLLKFVEKNQWRYIGELEVDDTPYVFRIGRDEIGNERRTIEFRLRAIGEVFRDEADITRLDALATTPELQPTVTADYPQEIQIEEIHASSFVQKVEQAERIAERSEQQLVKQFSQWMKDSHDVNVGSLRIPYKPEGRALRADAYIRTMSMLIEAKSSANRNSIRLALGQLLDYARFCDSLALRWLCILLPTHPGADILNLIDTINNHTSTPFCCVWSSSDRFVCHPTKALSTEKY